jgi:DNA-3-methyladenine glycosylase
MMSPALGPDFYEQHTLDVAEQLIGCYLIRTVDTKQIVVQINETEAYRGADDPASHAHRGVTPRNEPMFNRAGRIYMYLSYGMHHCMNIVTEPEGQPGAVLLRGAAPIEGIEWIRQNRPGVADRLQLNGPGKLTKALNIDLSFNRYNLCTGSPSIMIIPGHLPSETKRTERIGISKGRSLLWRFTK